MNPDDPVCLCFHVTRRKVVNYIRIEKPVRPSQLSQCFGAGTGCGWCRPYLERLLQESKLKGDSTTAREASPAAAEDLDANQYAQQRAQYVRRTGAVLPPGATPAEEP